MSQIKNGVVQANGLNFDYLEAGSGPLVLCLHGFADGPRSFRHQLTGLSEAGFRVVAPYWRGYIPEDIGEGVPYVTSVFAQDAVALLDALSPDEPAVLCGHDWGGLAAFGACLLAPQRVRRLISVGVPYGPQLMESLVGKYEQSKRSWYLFFLQMPIAEIAVANNDFEFFDHLWADWSPGWTVPPEEMEAVKEIYRQPGVLDAALSFYRDTFTPRSLPPELVELQIRIMAEPLLVPAMNIHGADDGCLGIGLLNGMDKFFPHGLRQMILPEAGHFVHQEKPDEVNRLIVDFLQGCDELQFR